MNKLKFLMILLGAILLLSNELSAQNDLYLRFEEEKEGQVSNDAFRGDQPLGSERQYFFGKYLYYGYSLTLLSLNYSEALIVSNEDLLEYPVVSPEDLENTLSSYTYQERMAYIDSFDKLYVVEMLPTSNQAKIVEVEIDIR